MTDDEYERAYDRLAVVLDELGPGHELAFLTRLALLYAADCRDLATFEAALAAASDGGAEP